MNCGQICLSPDYVLVDAAVATPLIAAVSTANTPVMPKFKTILMQRLHQSVAVVLIVKHATLTL
jgi:acyl-CoA reductase-like NAD-dependent aldehyde dehydrogenase